MSAGSSRSAAPNPEKNGEKHGETVPLKLFGMEIPLPPWAVSAVAVVAVIAAPVVIYFGIRHLTDDASLAQKRAELESLIKQQTEGQDSYIESTKHKPEAGEYFHQDPNLTVVRFPSDGCLSILRTAGNTTRSLWIKDPSRMSAPGTAPGALDGGVKSELTVPGSTPLYQTVSNIASPSLLALIPAKLIATRDAPPPSGTELIPVQQNPQCGGRCLNPHPGNFASQNGRTQGCWVQVWRTWQDGCSHYQWFNACSSSWDSEPNGQPRVYWTCCRH